MTPEVLVVGDICVSRAHTHSDKLMDAHWCKYKLLHNEPMVKKKSSTGGST